jgi:hypothetical protein
MERRVAKDFMITHRSSHIVGKVQHLLKGIILTLLSFIGSCSSDYSDDPIQYVSFQDIVINLTLYSSLFSDGGTAYVNGGARGIILYRVNNLTYVAYERNCSYQPNDACATVDGQPLDMKDSCCGSLFSYADGKPTNGPAWRPLNKYQTSLSGNTLTITDTLVE